MSRKASRTHDQKRKRKLAQRNRKSRHSSSEISPIREDRDLKAAVIPLLQEGVRLHQEGDLLEALRIYHEVLEHDPHAADAWNLTGVVAHQSGQQTEAIDNIRRAIAIESDIPQYQLNLAAALLADKQADEAEQSCRRCLKLDPVCAEAFSSLGNALRELGRLDEAIEAFHRALHCRPDYADAQCNLGILLFSIGRLDEAEQWLRQALAANPRLYQAHNNLGLIHQNRGSYDHASECYTRALQIQPGSPETLINQGCALRLLSRFGDALDCCARAIQLRPHHANAWCALGLVQQDIGHQVDAVASFREAVRLDPRSARAGSSLLFCLSLRTDLTPEEVFQEHCRWGQRFGRVDQASEYTNPPDPDLRLRIGYVSPDLRQHPVISFFEPLLAGLNREAFEVTCYAEVLGEDETTKRLRGLADRWRSTCGLTDIQVAEQIRVDGIDILVDLAGHTANNRLPVFAYKPAPVQASSIGYPNTTGLAAVDYFITDDILVDDENEQFFTEQLIRLPTGCCWMAPSDAPEVGASPFETNGYVTFGSMHRLDKLTDLTFDLWARVLKSQPDSRLLIFRRSLGHCEIVRERIWEHLQHRGIPRSRVDLRWECEGSYLTVYRDIDILLEVLPWDSGTTTYESLWMGVPILGLRADRPYSRPTLVALNLIGLTDLVAQTDDEYVDLITALSLDHKRLTDLRAGLRQRMLATVCDPAGHIGDMERAFRHMWRNWCDAHAA